VAQEVLVFSIEDIIDSELTETHADIAGKVEKALDNKKSKKNGKTSSG
jgi:hypothetical protein